MSLIRPKPGDLFYSCYGSGNKKSIESDFNVCVDQHSATCFIPYKVIEYHNKYNDDEHINITPPLLSNQYSKVLVGAIGSCSIVFVREIVGPEIVKVKSRLELILE